MLYSLMHELPHVRELTEGASAVSANSFHFINDIIILIWIFITSHELTGVNSFYQHNTTQHDPTTRAAE